MNALVILALPLILGVLVRAIICGVEEGKGNAYDAIRIRKKPTKMLEEVSPPKKIVEEKPIKTEELSNFPEWVNWLSEQELFDLVYASLGDRPEEAMRIIAGGETF